MGATVKSVVRSTDAGWNMEMQDPQPIPRRRAADRLDRRASDMPVPPSPNAKPRRRDGDGWLDRWVDTVSDLTRLKNTHPMVDAVIDEQVGRRIRIGDRWLADFASCNYLGFDLDEEIIAAVPEYLAKWGTHPSWSRLLGSPRMYEEIEEQMTELLDCEDVLLLPTITHIHTSVIPVLVGDGTIFLDGRAHKTIYDGSMYAAGHGATVVRFRHDDPEHLEELIRASDPGLPRVIAMDGVNSMTGNAPDVPAFATIAREHDALLYVDDAHGFGVVGERSPNELCSYGTTGNGVMRHMDVPYESSVFVAGFSKAYSSLLAFIALPTRLKDVLKVLAPPYLYSGPSPIASLATTLAGLEVNRTRGDLCRADLHRKTGRVLGALHQLGVSTPNRSGYPIVEVPLANHEEIDDVGRYLFDHGIYATMAAYPLVPKNEVGFRIQVTAANTDEEIDELIAVLGSLQDRFQLEQVHATV
ncbi:MAG TPA: pyridoxal phosphate-dependent aminotransferase family protein [Actinomycetota bacterium]|jgi:8-amino-7-oxononanoate synthase|nr:pyridoxal phosphate-dependent aminotransferase family protein [Actinomycetota bacterium]